MEWAHTARDSELADGGPAVALGVTASHGDSVAESSMTAREGRRNAAPAYNYDGRGHDYPPEVELELEEMCATAFLVDGRLQMCRGPSGDSRAHRQRLAVLIAEATVCIPGLLLHSRPKALRRST